MCCWRGKTYCCDPGITLRHGKNKGRLLMPAQVFVGSINKDGSRTYLNKGQGRKYFAKRHSNALYNDDGGQGRLDPDRATPKSRPTAPHRPPTAFTHSFVETDF